MICPNCHAEYREGFSTCADCEVPLVRDLADVETAHRQEPDGVGGEVGEPAWSAGDGSPDALVPLAELGSPEMLGVLLERLEEGQVPYVVQAGTAIALAVGRDLESPRFPDPWQARVMVLGAFRREARAMVDAVVAEAKEEMRKPRVEGALGLDR